MLSGSADNPIAPVTRHQPDLDRRRYRPVQPVRTAVPAGHAQRVDRPQLDRQQRPARATSATPITSCSRSALRRRLVNPTPLPRRPTRRRRRVDADPDADRHAAPTTPTPTPVSITPAPAPSPVEVGKKKTKARTPAQAGRQARRTQAGCQARRAQAGRQARRAQAGGQARRAQAGGQARRSEPRDQDDHGASQGHDEPDAVRRGPQAQASDPIPRFHAGPALARGPGGRSHR